MSARQPLRSIENTFGTGPAKSSEPERTPTFRLAGEIPEVIDRSVVKRAGAAGLLHLIVAVKTSSIRPRGPQTLVPAWLRRLSVQMGWETPLKETSPA